MTDLVSRVLEAIGKAERIAETAGRDGEPNWTAGGELSETVSTVKYGQPVATGPYGYLVPEVREHIAHNDPASVLRRCAADREIVELYRDSTKMHYDSDAPHVMLEVVEALARGYGLEVTE